MNDPDSAAIDYQLIQRDSPQSVHVRFSGMFQQRPVTWDAHICTLACIADSLERPLSLKKFIHIPEAPLSRHTPCAVIIGLPLPAINEAAIIASIIMVRQYKNLSTGKHEYGEPINFE